MADVSSTGPFLHKFAVTGREVKYLSKDIQSYPCSLVQRKIHRVLEGLEWVQESCESIANLDPAPGRGKPLFFIFDLLATQRSPTKNKIWGWGICFLAYLKFARMCTAQVHTLSQEETRFTMFIRSTRVSCRLDLFIGYDWCSDLVPRPHRAIIRHTFTLSAFNMDPGAVHSSEFVCIVQQQPNEGPSETLPKLCERGGLPSTTLLIDTMSKPESHGASRNSDGIGEPPPNKMLH